MKAEIANGSAPSVVFKRLMIEQELDNHEVALLFMEEFPDADSVAVNYIWKWNSPTRNSGIDDDHLDKRILDILTKAGYL